MSAVILDTETTGTSDDDQVIELAYTELMAAPRSLTDVDRITIAVQRFSSERPIGLGAMSTHHIIPDDLVGLPPFAQLDAAGLGITYIIGHSIDFDWRMLGRAECELALGYLGLIDPTPDESRQFATLLRLPKTKGASRIARPGTEVA